MIISYEHRFIFMHCRKTAGSSCSAYLNQFLGPKDLQIGAWDESKEAGGGYNDRFYADMKSKEGRKKMLAIRLKALSHFRLLNKHVLFERTQKAIYSRVFSGSPAHPSAAAVANFAAREWAEFFKFCFVRNPYEQAVSDYKWRTRSRPGISFAEFLKRMGDPSRADPEGVVPQSKSNWEIYTVDGKIAVDFVGRMERLEEGMASVCERLGLPFNAERFPRAKRSAIQKDYRGYYSEYEKSMVADLFEKEIKTFGYEF